jgi:L-lactate utilization protein LutB
MDKNTKWYIDEKIRRTTESLKKNNYAVYVVDTKEDAAGKIEDIIEKGSTVSFGGSMSIIECGILDILRNGEYNLLDRYKKGLTSEDIGKIFRESFFSDYYLTSTNALTENGELVNIDGNGNRAAAMMFGPRKVIVVAGINKIVRDIDEAYKRVRDEAAPINAKRLSKNTPCSVTGKCADCSSPERICSHMVVTYRQNTKDRGIVIIVKENIGY